MLSIEALQERVFNSELGREWANDPLMLMNRDVWSLTELGYSEEECRINGRYNLHLNNFSLPWLQFFSKLTIRATARQRFLMGRITHRVCDLKLLDKFLFAQGCVDPKLITDSLLNQFIAQSSSVSRKNTITYAINLWQEEQWLDISFTPNRNKISTPKIEVVPEEVLSQIYEKFDLLPAPLERLFRLQLVLGCRIGEIIKIPRQCLKNEDKQWFLLRWIEKRKYWRYYLKSEIISREPEQVRLSIEAFEQYRDSHTVKSQEACLLSMIREEAEPNTKSPPKTKKAQQKIVSTPDEPAKKLMSADKLKQLSNLFHNKDD